MNMELLEALKAFQQAAHKLDRAWDKVNASPTATEDPLAQGYPFKECFDDVVVKIDTWVETTFLNLV